MKLIGVRVLVSICISLLVFLSTVNAKPNPEPLKKERAKRTVQYVLEEEHVDGERKKRSATDDMAEFYNLQFELDGEKVDLRLKRSPLIEATTDRDNQETDPQKHLGEELNKHAHENLEHTGDRSADHVIRPRRAVYADIHGNAAVIVKRSVHGDSVVDRGLLYKYNAIDEDIVEFQDRGHDSSKQKELPLERRIKEIDVHHNSHDDDRRKRRSVSAEVTKEDKDFFREALWSLRMKRSSDLEANLRAQETYFNGDSFNEPTDKVIIEKVFHGTSSSKTRPADEADQHDYGRPEAADKRRRYYYENIKMANPISPDDDYSRTKSGDDVNQHDDFAQEEGTQL